ncbi:VapE domain-containing protein [[Ruminococcus] lactaris]|uniref:VapE domain-containing protein n=1 Tax=[Ruminococcus] lactaris TaxID=46228 RepID=UPI003FD748CA
MNRELQNMSEESLQNLEEIVETELLTVEDIRERMDTTEKGKIRQSIQNCKYALEHDPCLKGVICRNEMTCQIDIMKKMPWKRRGVHMTDTDMNNLALYLEKNYGLTSDRVIAKAIDIVANENSFHPILEYLESLKWDGIPRIQHMLTHFFGAEDIAYTGEVMKMHMMGAIRRLYEPGAKYDIMLCLVGGQGTGKSTFFRYLAIKDEWFTDDMKRIDDKKVYEYLQGHWIRVFPEKAEATIYENEAESRVYITQAWAEAMEIYRSGNYPMTFSPEMEDHVKLLQREFMPEDTQTGMIQAFLDAYEEDYVCSTIIYQQVFHQEGIVPKWQSKEISDLMDNEIVGWAKHGNHRFGGTIGTQRSWKRIQPKKDEEGFLKVNESMEIPFD